MCGENNRNGQNPEGIRQAGIQGPFCAGDGNGADQRRRCSLDPGDERRIPEVPDFPAEKKREMLQSAGICHKITIILENKVKEMGYMENKRELQ
jgi:hypothetical protein